MKVQIRKATKKDAEQAHQLIIDLAIYENEPESVSNTLEQFTEDGFGENPVYNLLVADDMEAGVIGMALYVYSYSTWKGKMLFLDDLVINKKFRRKGIGSLLIEELFKIAKQEKVKIIKWEVLDWNEPAIKLYKKLGAVFDDKWLACKFYENQIDTFKLR